MFKKHRAPARHTFEGIKITDSYTSPYKNEGMMYISQHKTNFLKDEFVSWFINYGINNKYMLSQSELAFILSEIQENKESSDQRKEVENKKSKKDLLTTIIVPIVIFLIAIIIVMYNENESSFIRFFSISRLIFPFLLSLILLMISPRLIGHLFKSGRDKLRVDEPGVIAQAMQNGHYTAYRLKIFQKKWKETYVSGDEDSSGYFDYNFYVEFDELTLEVDIAEYKKMTIGGSAIVVIIHTPHGDTMRVLAPR